MSNSCSKAGWYSIRVWETTWNIYGAAYGCTNLGEVVLSGMVRTDLGFSGFTALTKHTSLEYGRIRQDGLECCYHGWRFDIEGNCLDQPAEPPEKVFKDKVKHLAYSVQETGGLIWAYLGPNEAPILPKIDVVAREDGVRAVVELRTLALQLFSGDREFARYNSHWDLTRRESENRSDIWGERYQNQVGKKMIWE